MALNTIPTTATSSGTISQTTITVATLLEHAMRRCGLSPSMITPDMYKSASESMYFYLSALANDGVNLWTIQKYILGLNTNINVYDMPQGTIDVLEVHYRTAVLPAGGTAASSEGIAVNAFDQNLGTFCTQTTANGWIYYDFGTGNTVTNTMVGLNSNGNAVYTLAWQVSDDAITWTTIYTSPQTQFYDGIWQYWDLLTPGTGRFMRVLETGGGILNVREVVFAQNPTDIAMGRMNLDMYANFTNKQETGVQPLQYWVDRQIPVPRLWMWPVPNNPFVQVVVWLYQQIQDVGNLSDTLAVPQYWMDAIVTGMAARFCLEIPFDVAKGISPSPFERYQILKGEAEAALMRASDEERDNSPISMTPMIGVYTR